MSLERLSPAGAEMEHGQSQLFNDAEHFRNSMLRKYVLDGAYDEMFTAEGEARAHYRRLLDMFAHMPQEEIERCKKAADLSFLTQGITFTVYGEEQGTERVFPYDVVPRVISNAEWTHIERGLVQRIAALNMFLHDVYNDGRILADGKVPREVVYTCRHFRREMRGLQVPRNIYIAVSGTDLLRIAVGRVRGAGRQPARAERRELHADEPARDEADFPAALSRLRRAAD